MEKFAANNLQNLLILDVVAGSVYAHRFIALHSLKTPKEIQRLLLDFGFDSGSHDRR